MYKKDEKFPKNGKVRLNGCTNKDKVIIIRHLKKLGYKCHNVNLENDETVYGITWGYLDNNAVARKEGYVQSTAKREVYIYYMPAEYSVYDLINRIIL